MIPTGRRARPGPAGGRPAELYRPGHAWSRGGPIHRHPATTREVDEGCCPRPLRAAGRAAARGGRAARPRGRRGPRPDPRDDGQPDGLRARSAEAVHQPLHHRPAAAEAPDPRHASSRARSRRSARPSPSSRSATASSARRADSARTRSSSAGGRAVRSRTCRPALTFEEAAAVCDGAPRADVPAKAGLREGQRSSSTAPPDPSARRAYSSRSTSAPTSPRCATRRTSSSCDRSEPTRSIDYTQDDFTKNGETYDVIFDAVGKHSFRRCRRSLKPGGIYIDDRSRVHVARPAAGAADAVDRRQEGARSGSRSYTKEDVLLLKELIEAGALSGGHRPAATRSRTWSRRRGTSRRGRRRETSS